MPLSQSKSKKAFVKNLKTEMHEGKPQPQALAIAYSIKRKNKKKMASGGSVESGSKDMNYAEGGEVDYDAEHKRRIGENQDVLGNKKGAVSAGGHVRAANKEKEYSKNPNASYPSIHRSIAKDHIKEAKEKHSKKLETIRSMPKPKLAEGGMINAKNERRPMPEERDNDSKMVSRNNNKKQLIDSDWTDQPTVRQAQKNNGREVLPIKHPKMVPSNAFSTRLRDEEDDLQSSASPGPYGEQPPKHDNEEGPDRQGPKVSDMEDEHSTHRKPYAKGGMIDEMRHASKHDMEPSEHGIEEEECEDEAHLMSMESPSEDEGASEARSLNEERPNRQGDEVPDMEEEHSTGRKPYAKGGSIQYHDSMDNMDDDMELNPAHDKHSADDSEDQPEDEAELMHEASVAAAIMAKRRANRQDSDSDIDHEMMMAEGGEILEHSDESDIHSKDSIESDDSDQADLSRNADEDANEEDQLSYNALRKENYSETPGLNALDQPRDSNLKGDEEESDSENDHDRSIVSSIRRKMKIKSPISR